MINRPTPPAINAMLFLGIALTVLGAVAIASPAFAGTAVVWIIGALLVATGVLQFLAGWKEEHWSNKLAPLIMGVLSVLAGFSVLAHPIFGLTILTLVLAIAFVVQGIWKVIASFSYRPAKGWIAFLISGLLTIGLGGLIWWQWPLSGMWAIGVLVGIDLLTTGVMLIALSFTLRSVAGSFDEAARQREATIEGSAKEIAQDHANPPE